ncbi:hypothetical protein BG015_010502 [Linnemannia schmuckeri]|uniref:Uncharacterized protein n=1 Tax=Linnemannia schmuckeri TaxID=64567 RepID=A0A9P5V913_9FUNG|nr:hypothetical protein BG015_010502 [Linnemannia schmuckeri]
MGIVDLDCIVSNPNSNILYGIGNAENRRGYVVTVLYRSNINPANVTDINWKELGRTSSYDYNSPDVQPHYKYSRFGNVDCAVSTSGEFTAFFYNPQFSVTGRARLVPMGIRFRPNVIESATEVFEPLEIYGSTMYGWTNQDLVHQSFYIEKDGVETAIHAVMDETATVIRFGLVDKDTGYLQLAAVWKLVDGRFMMGDLTDRFPKLPNPKATTFNLQYSPAPTVNTDQRHMVYQNGTLYLYSDATGLISSLPFSSPLTTPTQKDFFQASPIPTNKRNMLFQGTRQNSSYLGYLTRTDNSTSPSNLSMQLSTIDFINPSNLATFPAINRTARDIEMEPYGSNKDVAYLQAIGGQLPGQVPFAVGLTRDGYYGITLEGPSMGSMLPLDTHTSTIEGVEDRYFRSRFRNHDDQVVPGYKDKYSTELSGLETFGAVIGAIFGLLILLYPCSKFNRWLEKIRLDDERRAADMTSFELIARLRHVSGHPSSNPSPMPTTVEGGGGGGAFPFDSSSANTTSHTLLDGLGLTRHPRPNTVITIGDDEDELAHTRRRADTQQ